MANPSWSRIKKSLEPMDAPELVAIIKQLYDLNPTNKGALASIFDPVAGRELLRDRARREIENAFFKDRGFPSFKTGAARKALREYVKVVSLRDGIEMMLYYVEKGIQGTNTYGDIHENFYTSIEIVFEEALKSIEKMPEPKEYLNQLHHLVNKTDGIGWGFHDQMGDYLHFFEEAIADT
jgi:hypothetical protein